MTLKTEVKNTVPFASQHDESVALEWRSRVCGIAALRMALGGVLSGVHVPTVGELVTEAIAEAYLPKIGWKHDGLVKLAHRYGAPAYRKEFRVLGGTHPALVQVEQDRLFHQGVAELRHGIDARGVPIISITMPGKEGSHLVALTGYGIENGVFGFFYYDPDLQSPETRFLNIEELDTRWRRLAIFINKLDVKATYLASIRGSVGSEMFRHDYMLVDGAVKDLLEDGELSCTFYVSYILKTFGLIRELYARAENALIDMEFSGWRKTDSPREGDIVVWEAKQQKRGVFPHVGFYVNETVAISHRDTHRTPIEHSLTFEGQREVTAYYTHDFLA